MREERGSALITVILVVLVLTMVGIAALLFMSSEDRISGNDKAQKACLYVAESGMREAEQMVRATFNAGSGVATPGRLLGQGGTQLTLPGGGYPAIPLWYLTPVTGTPQGGLPGTSYDVLDKPVATGTYTGSYSLYVRNNSEDPSQAPFVDNDSTVNLVVVAQLQVAGGTIQKILEEQMFAGGAGGGERLMKGGNIGGTGAAGIGGG